MFRDNKQFVVVLGVVLAFLIYFYGGLSATLGIFPANLFKDSYTAALAIKKALAIDEYNKEIRWTRPALLPRGVVAGAAEGYVLYLSGADTTARLIDTKGEVLHTWNADFSKIWENQDRLISLFPLDDSYFYLRDFHLYENGDIVLIVSAGGITPWGVGLVKLDKDSNVLWKYDSYVNNDFHVAQDGTLYAIFHKIRYEPMEMAPEQSLPFLEDNIAVLDQEGREIKTFSLIGAIERSPFKTVLKRIENDVTGDPTHSNSIEEVRADVPGVAWLKKGNLLISVRNINTLVAIDPKTEEVVHAAGLPARFQHDVDLLESGHFMIFDNRGHIGNNGYSRVLEFDPVTLAQVWNYGGGPGDAVFDNKYWGTQQVLPNGNIQIVDAEQGRILEVTRGGGIAWEYRSPLVLDYDAAPHAGVITHAERITKPLSFMEKSGQ